MSDERSRWRFAGLAVLGLALAAFVIASNPANLPAPWIERWLLQKLPLGSSIVAVRDAIDDEGWKTADEFVQDTGSLVLVEIGRTWPSREHVYVHFSFDRFGRLGGVRVEKTPTPWVPTGGKIVPVD
ncbi:MAG TPA: hypothetical protein VF432_23725 [Thermoanaerobaculia bacterium]